MSLRLKIHDPRDVPMFSREMSQLFLASLTLEHGIGSIPVDGQFMKRKFLQECFS